MCTHTENNSGAIAHARVNISFTHSLNKHLLRAATRMGGCKNAR